MPPNTGEQLPTYGQCVRAARAVRAAPYGREARDTVRPRGVAGVIRARGPLPLILYLAAREGRLVWQDPGGFALLEPPLTAPGTWQPRGPWLGTLHWIDRRWSVLQFGLPPVAVLLVALPVGLVPGLLLAAMLLITVAMAYTVGVMVAMVFWQVFVGRRGGAERLALESVLNEHWSTPLVHQDNERRVDELLDRTRTRFRRLVQDRAGDVVADLEAQLGELRVSGTLVCLRSGMTSDAVRNRIEVERNTVTPFGTGSSFSLRLFDARPGDLPRRPRKPAPFFRFYLVAVIAAVFGLAFLISMVERDRCGRGPCAGGLTDFRSALWWIAYQLQWRDVATLQPTSDFALGLGWLLAYLPVVVVLVGVVAFWERNRAVAEARRAMTRRRRTFMGNTRVLIVTVAEVERDAVLDAFEKITGEPVDVRYDHSVPVFSLGAINDTELFVVQVGTQGLSSAAGLPNVTADAIRNVNPHYALIVGMCYGLRPDEQSIGDILVSERIHDLDHSKLVDVGGEVEQRFRGELVVPSPMLVSDLRAAQWSWSRISPVPVRVGLMLAWNTLLNAHRVTDELRRAHPDAIGGDMEGAGFYATTRYAGVEAILVKGICDWGADKTKEHQRRAADNAAGYVAHLVVSGVLANTPDQRRGN